VGGVKSAKVKASGRLATDTRDCPRLAHSHRRAPWGRVEPSTCRAPSCPPRHALSASCVQEVHTRSDQQEGLESR
jgi:hypothetical protein